MTATVTALGAGCDATVVPRFSALGAGAESHDPFGNKRFDGTDVVRAVRKERELSRWVRGGQMLLGDGGTEARSE
jgi:hypothetical protein